MAALTERGVTGKAIRIAAHDVRPRIKTDMGDATRAPGSGTRSRAPHPRPVDADVAGPRLQHRPASAEAPGPAISESDNEGRTLNYGKAAAVCAVGNEDRAQVSADLFQGLNDVGPLAPNAVTYWVGEAMQGTDYQDLDKTPEATIATAKALAANTTHLARQLRGSPYPSV
ncbi:NADPH-dependent oxidoreductase [Streptomyces mirabilis]